MYIYTHVWAYEYIHIYIHIYIYICIHVYVYTHTIYAYIFIRILIAVEKVYKYLVFDLCRSEIHIYINDICIKFPSRVTIAHSIPAKNTKSP
jgi:hypothetical protein